MFGNIRDINTSSKIIMDIEDTLDQLSDQTNAIKQYWENYDKNLWHREQFESTDINWMRILEKAFEAFLILMVILLAGVIFYCLKKKNRSTLIHDSESGCGSGDPPTYDDVIKKEKDELESLNDLPSYLQAVTTEKMEKPILKMSIQNL